MAMRDPKEWAEWILAQAPSHGLYGEDYLAALIREAQEDGARAEHEKQKPKKPKTFPVMGEERPRAEAVNLGPARIPWDLVEPLRDSCLRFHDQTLERLAERGGLSRGELHMHVHGLRWPERDIEEVRAWFDEWSTSDIRVRIVDIQAQVAALTERAERAEEQAKGWRERARAAETRVRDLKSAGFAEVADIGEWPISSERKDIVFRLARERAEAIRERDEMLQDITGDRC